MLIQERIKTFIRVGKPSFIPALICDLKDLGLEIIKVEVSYFHFAEIHFLNRDDINLALTAGIIHKDANFIKPMQLYNHGYEVFVYWNNDNG